MTDPAREPEPGDLSDTVADEELAPEDGVEAAPPPPPRTPYKPLPIPKFREETERRPPPPEPSRFPSAGHDIGLVEHIPDRKRAQAITEGVDLVRIFDHPTQTDENPMGRYDPEAGRGDVAIKMTAATEAVAEAVKATVSGTFTTPFGRLVLSIFVGLAGLALTIAAITIQDRWMIIGAAAVMPLGLLLVYWRYQAWLGHKRYLYRLLETLGEDVSDFRPDQAYRRTKVKTTKQRR